MWRRKPLCVGPASLPGDPTQRQLRPVDGSQRLAAFIAPEARTCVLTGSGACQVPGVSWRHGQDHRHPLDRRRRPIPCRRPAGRCRQDVSLGAQPDARPGAAPNDFSAVRFRDRRGVRGRRHARDRARKRPETDAGHPASGRDPFLGGRSKWRRDRKIRSKILKLFI